MNAPSGRIRKAGIYDLPADVYHGDCVAGPTLSAHGAIEIEKFCPSYYWHHHLNPDRPPPKSEPNAEIGQAAHVLALEPEKWDEKVTVIKAPDWRMPAARELREYAISIGKIAINLSQEEIVRAMHAALMAHPEASRAFQGGRAEPSLIWRDQHTGIWCKGRPDYLRHLDNGARLILDYKTVPCAAPAAVERQVWEMGYHQQAAWYIEGERILTGATTDATFLLIAQEREYPYLVTVNQLHADAIEYGAKQNRRARQVFAECWQRGEWPSYRDPAAPHEDRVFVIGLPVYAQYQLAQRDALGHFSEPKKPKKSKPSTALKQRAMRAQAPL